MFELLCRKKGDDGSGTYTTYLNEHDRTISYRGICVAALLCMDAANEPVRPSERHVALLRRMEFRNTAASVLCIPARMASYDTEAVVSDWSRHTTVALANGVSAKASVVWLINEAQAMTISKDQNAVLMVQCGRS